MANTLVTKNRIDGAEPTSTGGLTAGELAIKQVAAACDASAASGKLYYGEDVGDGSDPDGTVVAREFGIGIKTADSGTQQVGVPIGGNLIFDGSSGVTCTASNSGDVTTVAVAGSGLDNYSSWTIAGDDDSSTVTSGQTVTMAGTAPISTVNTSRSIAFSIDNDGITDTHLAYNTGQHLTTSSSVEFGELDVDYWNLNGAVLSKSSGSMKIYASDSGGGSDDGEIYLHARGGNVFMRSGTSSGNWNRFIFNLGLSESIMTSYLKMKLVTGSSSDFTVDSAADIILDADSGNWYFKDAGTTKAKITGGGNFQADGYGQFDGAYIAAAGDNAEIRMYEGSNYVGFEAGELSGDQIWVLPTADGSSGQHLTTNSSGTLSWASSTGDANQNAWSHITVPSGTTTQSADAVTDTIAFTAAGGMTITGGGDDTIAFSSANDNTQNEYATSWVDSTNDVLLRLTESGAGSGTQDIKLVAGTGITLTPSGTNMTIAAPHTTDTNTTYTHTWQDSSDNAILRLTAGGSGSGNDDLTIVAGNNITLTPSGDDLTIAVASLDDYSSWTIAADDDSSTVSSGETVTMAGTAPISTVNTSRSIAFSIDNDGITDTHLAYNTGQHLTTTSAPTFATVNTGQGNNELYDMNQNVQTTDAVTFATVNTGQGNNELYDMNQNVQTTDAVTFTTVNTGQGANELYDMDQNVKTTDDVTFNELTLTEDVNNSITATGTHFKLDAAYIAMNVSNNAYGFQFRFDGDEQLRIWDEIVDFKAQVYLQLMTSGADLSVKHSDGRVLLRIDSDGFTALKNGASGPGELRFYEDSDHGSHYTGFKAGNATASVSYVLPLADGSSGQHLTTNSSGTLSWASSTGESNEDTNLSATANGTSLTIESSTGTNVALPAATTSAWGIMSDDQATKLSNIETSADVTDATNVNSAGATMNSDLTSTTHVYALDQSVVSGATPTFTTTNFTDASNKRLMTDAQETILDNTSGTNTGDNTVCTSGAATTATQLYINNDESGDTSCYVLFTQDSSAGNKAVYEDSGLVYDNTNNKLTTTTFVGALTGNASGSSASCTGNAATVTTNANLTGDVTSSGNATTIATDAVDIAMLSASGTASSTTFLRGDNSWVAPTASVADGDKGSITVSSSGSVWTIDNTAVTNAMLADDAVGADELASNAVVNASVASGAAIATSKLSGAVTDIGSHGLAASATTNALNASNISSGTLAAARVATLNQDTTGTATNATNAANVYINTDDTGDTSCQIPFIRDTGGANRALYEDAQLLYNNTSNYITANLTGNVTGALTGNASGSSGSCTGNAATATALASARTFRTNLASTSTASFDGTGNVTPGVTGTLAVGSGGTGVTTMTNLKNALDDESWTFASKITADAGIDIDNFNIDGTTIALSSGDLTIDVASEIKFDAGSGDFRFIQGGTECASFCLDTVAGELQIRAGTGTNNNSVTKADGLFKIDSRQIDIFSDSAGRITLGESASIKSLVCEDGNVTKIGSSTHTDGYVLKWTTTGTDRAVWAAESGGGGGGDTDIILVDGDGTTVTLNDGKYIKFIESTGIDIDFTDTSTGSVGDPFDLTFSIELDALIASDAADSVLTTDGDGTMTAETSLTVPADGEVNIVKTGGGDPILTFQIDGQDKWTIGCDDSDSDLFKIDSGAALTDSGAFEFESNGTLTAQTQLSAPLLTQSSGATSDDVANSTLGGMHRIDFTDGICNGNVVLGSDESIKDNIVNYTGTGMSLLNALSPKSFTYKEDYQTALELNSVDTSTHVGYIAQDLQAISAAYVEEVPDPRTEGATILKPSQAFLDDERVSMLQVIKELSVKNAALEARIVALEAA